MPQKRIMWVSVDQFHPAVQGLLRSFHTVFGLHNTNNVLVDAYAIAPARVIIRRYGRLSAWQVTTLNKMVGSVEIGARARGYLDIYLFGPAAPEDVMYDSQEAVIRFRALDDVRPHLCGGDDHASDDG